MILTAALSILTLTSLTYGQLVQADTRNLSEQACRQISNSVSNASAVLYPTDPLYAQALLHWTNSSSQQSQCVFEPATTDDLSKAIKIIGYIRAPFAVKSGGHAMNPKFSSTTGVEIVLSKFTQVQYDAASSTVKVGTGLVWDDVYSALAPDNVIVSGGRVTGIGVGGFSTGGGYSWKANQIGLTIDTITEYDLVLPNGTFAQVTASNHPDLFFGLKGGLNNFGVVTGITLKAFPQGQVFGGIVVYSQDQLTAVAQELANFSANNTDPKASIIISYDLGVNGNFAGITPIALIFYDGPTPPAGTFGALLTIPNLFADVSARSYLQVVQSSPVPSLPRGAFHSVSLTAFSQNILNVIANETTFWGKLQPSSGLFFSYDMEPFTGFNKHATPSAYPHDRPLFLLNVYFAWSDPAQDDTFFDALKTSVNTIYQAALAEGQDISIQAGKQIRYPNYALFDTPLSQLYGSNVQMLSDIRERYDTNNVMLLTGGFKLNS